MQRAQIGCQPVERQKFRERPENITRGVEAFFEREGGRGDADFAIRRRGGGHILHIHVS